MSEGNGRTRTRFDGYDALNVAVLVVLAIVVCWPMFREGTLPVDTRTLLDAAPWRDLSQPPRAPEGDPYAVRESLVRYPDQAFLAMAHRNRDSLHWSGLEYGGAPFLARWDAGALSPFSIPLRLFPFENAVRFGALLKILAAALSAYAAARLLGLPGPLGLPVALTYGFAGGLLLWLGHTSSDVMPWLPLLFLGTERLAEGRIRAWPVAAVALTLMFLGGDGFAALAALGVCAVYLLVRLSMWRKAPRRLAAVTVFGFAVVVGLAGAAMQLLPWLDYRAWASPRPGAPVTIPGVLDFARSLATPLASAGGASEMLARESVLFQAGAVYLLMAMVWFALRRHVASLHRSRVDALVVTALFVLSCAAIPAAFQAARGASAVGYHQLLLFLPWALGLIAAVAMLAWLELDPSQAAATLRRLAWFVPVLLALFALHIAFDGRGGPERTTLNPAGLALDVILFLGGLGLLAATLFRPSPQLAGYGLAALFGVHALSVVPSLMVFGEPVSQRLNPAFTASVQGGTATVGGTATLKEWPLAAHGIRQRYGTASRPSRAMHDYLASTGNGDYVGERLVLTSTDLRGRYAVQRPELEMLGAFPQGMAVFRGSVANSRIGFADVGRVTHGDSATMLSESNDHVLIRVETTDDAELVLRDSYHPDWTATVDGEAAPIQAHDGVYRSVRVPAGAHDVEFRYQPPAWTEGLIVSAIAIAIQLAGLGYLVLRKPQEDGLDA